MNNLNFNNFALAAIACNTAFIPQAMAIKKTEVLKPNVLFIVVDDWGARDLSFAGSSFYETPNIDKLAGQSTSFSNAYVAYPRSVPSRFSLWTGMHCSRPQGLGKGTEADERKIDKSTLAIAEPFKAVGYSSFFIGKWHLATYDCLPQDKGFDTNIGGGHAGATSSHFAPFNQNYKAEKARDEGGRIDGMDDAENGEYLTDYMSRKVVDFIKQDHKEPFMAVCSFYAVHTPLQAKKEIIAKYEAKKKTLGLTADNYIPEEAGERKVQQNNAIYAAMVESVDQGVGKMITALKESGHYDNTIIIVVSDNGGLSNRGAGNKREVATNNDPYKAGKGHLYEGGIKTPLLIHLPKQSKPATSDVLTAGYDLFPTLAELCNVPVNKKLDGVSLASVVKGDENEALSKRAIYWHKAAERPASTGDYVSTAIRSGNYKLIDFYQQKRVELYDLSSDISETKNIANEKPEITKQLMAKIQQWRKDLNVNMPKENKNKNKK